MIGGFLMRSFRLTYWSAYHHIKLYWERDQNWGADPVPVIGQASKHWCHSLIDSQEPLELPLIALMRMLWAENPKVRICWNTYLHYYIIIYIYISGCNWSGSWMGSIKLYSNHMNHSICKMGSANQITPFPGLANQITPFLPVGAAPKGHTRSPAVEISTLSSLLRKYLLENTLNI